jgi:hypothetical protein
VPTTEVEPAISGYNATKILAVAGSDDKLQGHRIKCQNSMPKGAWESSALRFCDRKCFEVDKSKKSLSQDGHQQH